MYPANNRTRDVAEENVERALQFQVKKRKGNFLNSAELISV